MARSPDRSTLTQPQREVLTLAEGGKTAPEIAKQRGVSINAVHVMMRRLRSEGFDVRSAGGNGGGRRRRRTGRPSNPPARQEPRSAPSTSKRGVAAVREEAEAQKTALSKERDNALDEAKRLRAEADARDKQAEELRVEVENIGAALATLNK